MAFTSADIYSALNALYRTTASTLAATLLMARQLYMAIIRASRTYGANAWHRPSHQLKDNATDVQKQQNVGLIIVLQALHSFSTTHGIMGSPSTSVAEWEDHKFSGKNRSKRNQTTDNRGVLEFFAAWATLCPLRDKGSAASPTSHFEVTIQLHRLRYMLFEASVPRRRPHYMLFARAFSSIGRRTTLAATEILVITASLVDEAVRTRRAATFEIAADLAVATGDAGHGGTSLHGHIR